MKVYERAAIRNTYSALRYELVTFDGGADYTPSSIFKGLHVTTGGNVEIVGVDGESIIMQLTPGTWPYGGTAINFGGTTMTDLIALF